MMGNPAQGCLFVIFLFLSETMATKQNIGFKVLVPSAPVVSSTGRDIILLCHLSPEMSAASKEIRWFKESFTNLVYLWDSGKVTEGTIYKGRVSLFPQELQRGNVSLLLRDVKVSDEGQYSCHVSDSSWYEEPSMNLLVISRGTTPDVTVVESSSDSVVLGCTSQGWHPEPKMFWRDEGGQNLSSQMEKPKQMTGGTYTITSRLTLEATSQWRVECVLTEPTQEVQLFSLVQFKEESLGSTQRAPLYLSVALTLFAVAFASGAVYVYKRRREYLVSLNKTGLLEQNLKDLERVCEDRKKELDTVKTIPNSVWNLIYEHEAKVTLDHNTAHKYLFISEDGKKVRWQENKNVSDNKKRFQGPRVPCVMANTGFHCGKHYWEVTVGEKTHWYIGVVNENVKRDGNLPFTPKNGFWVLRLNDNNLSAITDNQLPHFLPKELIPHTLGVFVDYNMQQVSFYNVEQRCHIFAFTVSTTEELYPFLGLPPQCKLEMSISTVDRSSADRSAQRGLMKSYPNKHHIRDQSADCCKESKALLEEEDRSFSEPQEETACKSGGPHHEGKEKNKGGKFRAQILKVKSKEKLTEDQTENCGEQSKDLIDEIGETLTGSQGKAGNGGGFSFEEGVKNKSDKFKILKRKFKPSEKHTEVQKEDHGEQSVGLKAGTDEALVEIQENTECDEAEQQFDEKEKKTGIKLKEHILKLRNKKGALGQQEIPRESASPGDKKDTSGTNAPVLGERLLPEQSDIQRNKKT